MKVLNGSNKNNIILIKYVKMEKIDFYLMGTVYGTDEEGIITKKVYTGENRDAKNIEISWAVFISLQEFLTSQPERQVGTSYKRNEDGVPELYYTSSSGVLQPLEIEGEIVSFKLFA
jgi:hypothetical protein